MKYFLKLPLIVLILIAIGVAASLPIAIGIVRSAIPTIKFEVACFHHS